MKLLTFLFFSMIFTVSGVHAADHVYCSNDSKSLQAKIVFYGDLSQGSGFVMLANNGAFTGSSSPEARVFSDFLIFNELKILTSKNQPETLVIASDLEKVIVFDQAGQLLEVLNCATR